MAPRPCNPPSPIDGRVQVRPYKWDPSLELSRSMCGPHITPGLIREYKNTIDLSDSEVGDDSDGQYRFW